MFWMLAAAIAAPVDPVAGPATTCDGRPSTWVDRTPSDTVRCAAGLESDCARGAAGLVEVRRGLAEVVGVPTTPPVLLWLVTSSATIRSGVAMTHSVGSATTIYIYSPSCDPDPRPRQFEKTIAQELAGPFLRAATNGWRFTSAPSWFVQGSEEWVARQVHERPTDLAALAVARASASPLGAVRVDGDTLSVQERYRDGEALVAYLVVERGPDVLGRVLSSGARTFDAALVDVTGAGAADLGRRYQAWRAAR